MLIIGGQIEEKLELKIRQFWKQVRKWGNCNELNCTSAKNKLYRG